jgi:hypothetical protein
MYGFKALLDKNPVTISAAVVAVVGAAVISGWVTISVEALAAWNTALVLALGLFVNSRTANVAVLNELADTPPTVEGVPLAPAAAPAKKAPAKKVAEKGQSVPGILATVLVVLFVLWLVGVRF